jgi:hypothetical protein
LDNLLHSNGITQAFRVVAGLTLFVASIAANQWVVANTGGTIPGTDGSLNGLGVLETFGDLGLGVLAVYGNAGAFDRPMRPVESTGAAQEGQLLTAAAN